MSRSKTKVPQGFRLDPQVVETIRKMAESDPVTFQSYSKVVDAALYHFTALSRSDQKRVMVEYLTRNIKK